jgi:hypothetical protein
MPFADGVGAHNAGAPVPGWGHGAGALARDHGDRRADATLRTCARRRKRKIARLGEPERAR